MAGELSAAFIGGIAGAASGALGAWITGYWAPRKLAEEREQREEERVWGPRKRLIREMLDKADWGWGRSFEVLRRVSGTPDDELRRILIELGARGYTRDDGTEGWIYKNQRPLTQDAREG